MKNFIAKNYVVLSALLSAVVLVLQQALQTKQTDTKAILFAILLAVVGVVANQWKGKGLTVLGILATLAGTFQTIWETGVFTWNEFILSSIVAVLLAGIDALKNLPGVGQKTTVQPRDDLSGN